MKKLVKILFTAVLLASIASVGANAQDGKGEGKGKGEKGGAKGEKGQGKGGGGGEGRPQRPSGGYLMMLPVHAALDVDKNGEISADEIGGAAEVLGKLDKNGDGKLTEDELRPQGMGRPPQGPSGGDSPKGGGGQSGTSMADRLKTLDKNGNGDLEAAELPEQFRDRMLERLDKNADSVISKEELGAAAQSMGNRGGGGSAGKGEKGKGGAGKGGSGKGGAESGGSVKPKRPPLEE